MTNRLLCGDALALLKTLPSSSVDAVVTDPPYALEFMGKAWDRFDKGDAPGSFQHWCEMWARECLRVLKPGGHLLAFGGTRTWHRLTAGIEDAGFEIRDSIAWLYGSGFPKSLDVSKAIDKGSGQNLARQQRFQAWMRSTGVTPQQINTATGTQMGHHWTSHPTQPSIATADLFDLVRPLLPTVPEEIERLIAERTGIAWTEYVRRPVLSERPAYGIGGGGILGGHAEGATARTTVAVEGSPSAAWQGWGTALKPAFEPIVVARKPLVGTVAANVIAHGTGALNIDGCRIETGDVLSQGSRRPGRNYDDDTYEWIGQPGEQHTGGRWPANVILDESQAAALDEQSGYQRDGVATNRNRGDLRPMTVAGAPRAVGAKVDVGYGSGGGASRFFYVAKAPKSERPVVDGIAHPTVKPLALMRYLIRLATPPGGVLLDPFAGSGTTLEAAELEGFDAIGIEREAEYLPLIEARLERAGR